jgi:hypothetical protein
VPTAADLKEILGLVLQIVTAVGVVVAAIGGVVASVLSRRNAAALDAARAHLGRQDAVMDLVASKVGMLAAVAPPATDRLRERVDGLAEQLRAIRDEPGPGG